ncbi:hypothetical protein MMPV_002699 [Pyropia vietnamensis]
MEVAISLFPMCACIGTAVATAAYAARRAQTVDILLGLLDDGHAGGLADGSGGSDEDGRMPGVGAPLSLRAAFAFPFVASAALLFMFFFYAGISALLAVVVTLSSALALSYLFFPALDEVMGRVGGGWSRLPASPDASPSSSALLGAGGVTAAGLASGSSRRRGIGGVGGGGGGGGGGAIGGSGSDGGPAAAATDAVASASSCCGAAVPSPSVVATALLVAAALSGWLMTGHWALNNLLGVAQCVLFVSLVRVHAAVTSLRVCTLLLAGLFVYDVFWVFASAHLFGTNVMVAVATQDATNPVASAAAALHLPVAPVARLALPVKLVFPTGDGGGLMLGLGDIFVPGLLLGLVLAFDTTTAAAAAMALAGAPSSATASATGATRRGGVGASINGSAVRRGCWPADSIFPLALLGYTFGLVCSFVANGVFGVAQPALLYLVPATVGPVVAATASRGDLGELWRGPVVYGAVPRSRGGLPTPATAVGDGGTAVC